jgi:hypothetical protein
MRAKDKRKILTDAYNPWLINMNYRNKSGVNDI